MLAKLFRGQSCWDGRDNSTMGVVGARGLIEGSSASSPEGTPLGTTFGATLGASGASGAAGASEASGAAGRVCGRRALRLAAARARHLLDVSYAHLGFDEMLQYRAHLYAEGHCG